jgi:hypothetical protein
MNSKIQFLCLGFSAGLVAFAVAPQVEIEAKAESQRPSIWSVEETEPSTERGEVIDLSDSILDAVESTKPAVSLPAGPLSEQQETVQENGAAVTAESKVQGPLNTPGALTLTMNGKQYDPNCPGGVCPSPNYSYQTMTRGQQRRAARRR